MKLFIEIIGIIGGGAILYAGASAIARVFARGLASKAEITNPEKKEPSI